jgi:hypothetical protein
MSAVPCQLFSLIQCIEWRDIRVNCVLDHFCTFQTAESVCSLKIRTEISTKKPQVQRNKTKYGSFTTVLNSG